MQACKDGGERLLQTKNKDKYKTQKERMNISVLRAERKLEK